MSRQFHRCCARDPARAGDGGRRAAAV